MSPIKNEEWTQLIVPNSGRIYWYNVTNGESRWDVRYEGGPYNDIKSYSGPQVVSYPRLCQPDARIAKEAHHNRDYHSLNGAYEYADDQYQKGRRPQYQFMTPPRAERKSSVEPGSHPGQCNQVLVRPPHQRDSVAASHRKSYSYANHTDLKWILQKPEELQRRDLLSMMYHEHKTQNGPNLPEDALDHPRHTMSTTMEEKDQVLSHPPSNVMESRPDNYNKDYIRLSHDYNRMAKYRVNCKTDLRPVCVSCHNKDRPIEKILFPCEHVCLCTPCLISFLPKRCPLCKENIQKILDCNGFENEEYWKWVEEVRLEVMRWFLAFFFLEIVQTWIHHVHF